MVLLVDDFLQVPDLCFVEIFGVVLAAPHVLELVHQTGLKLVLKLFDLLLPLDLEGILLLVKHRDLSQQLL